MDVARFTTTVHGRGLLPSSLLRTTFEGRPGRSAQNGEVVSPDCNSRWTPALRAANTGGRSGAFSVPEFGAGLRRPLHRLRFGSDAVPHTTFAKRTNVAKPGQPTEFGGVGSCRFLPTLPVRTHVRTSTMGHPPWPLKLRMAREIIK